MTTIEKEDFASLLDEYMPQSIERQVVKGVVISIHKDIVTVDVGLKAEGQIPLREFAPHGKEASIDVGDEIEVYVERMEGRTGETLLSRERARREEAWSELEKKLENNEQIEGIIFNRVRGGFTVDLDGAIAFLPGSQIDIKPIRDMSSIMNIQQSFRILSMDRLRGNIVVSRRAVLEESRASLRTELISNLSEGQILDGVVKNITDYGVFIDLGGMDGLLHVTDISWRRINHPSEILTHGQSVQVKVIKFDEKNQRVSLGMKQMQEDPWVAGKDKYVLNSKHTGKITNITDYGAFIELEEGIEGLLHISEMSWTKKNIHPSKLFSTSQEIEVMILEIDDEKRRISLGAKQCFENPWETFSVTHPIDSVHEGIIKNITGFGLFVGITDDIDGMVHISDLFWNSTGEEEIEQFNKNDTIQIKILDIDIEKERVSLGVKQLTENPVTNAIATVKKGDIVTCDIVTILDNGIEVDVNGVSGFVSRANLSKEKSEQRTENFAVGEKIDAKITSVDKATSKLTLSIKAHEVAEEKKVIEAYGSADAGASLGDILGAALQKKESEEENKKK